jgi:hypothetical protein
MISDLAQSFLVCFEGKREVGCNPLRQLRGFYIRTFIVELRVSSLFAFSMQK